MANDRCGYDWDVKLDPSGGYGVNAKRGMPFNYFTQAVACSEVEIDCLTGDMKVDRVDIVMDLGNSINPAIDIGQIEGAFVQGMGWCTTEEMIWGDSDHPWIKSGNLLTKGPGNYKIPSFNDVPSDFRVALLNDHPNPVCVHSSKAVGEPPFFLAVSVFLAIKEALYSQRLSAGGGTEYFSLLSPASSERIRMACLDPLMKLSIAESLRLSNIAAAEDTKVIEEASKKYQAKGSW